MFTTAIIGQCYFYDKEWAIERVKPLLRNQERLNDFYSVYLHSSAYVLDVNQFLSDCFLSVVNRVKTPGGNLVVQYLSKKSQQPKCGDCGVELAGVSRPWKQYKPTIQYNKTQRTLGVHTRESEDRHFADQPES